MVKVLYFDWMYDIICGKNNRVSYRKLMRHLHAIEFYWMRDVPMDANRAEDGKRLRIRFEQNTGICSDEIDGPASVLEVIFALAKRVEENILEDPRDGDRTAQWFWEMMTSLGLAGMNDNNYNQEYVDDVIDIFLRREYESDGQGGLFTVENPYDDMRYAEIWAQMNWWVMEK